MNWDKIKEFYAFTKFKIIVALVFFAVVMVPPMINDDIYFAAPWIWHILAPPTLLENFFRGSSEWILVILWWPLMLLWFYTIASIIQKVGISK